MCALKCDRPSAQLLLGGLSLLIVPAPAGILLPLAVRALLHFFVRFEDKVCLVTGGGSGIGRATCMQLAAEGGRVAVIDVDEARARQVAESIGPAGDRSLALMADVGVSAHIRRSVDSVVTQWGRIDVLVNNAAMMTFDPIAQLPDDAWDRLMNVNLKSVFLFCKCALPYMPDGSAIVNVSSVHAHETTRGVVPYATSKGGMEAFTRGFSEELVQRKIRINCVAPGAVDTPMLWHNPNVLNGTEAVRGAVGKPEDVAAAICFLAAPEARFITGTTLVVDGGRLDIL